MDETFRLGRIAGIRIGANWSLLVVFWLISWSLAELWFPDQHPGHSPGVYWAVGLLTAAVFFASLVAHELGHSLMARRHGVQVDRITLWLFGGVAKLGSDAGSARAELQVAVAGPAVSFGAAGIFGLVALVLDGLDAPGIVVGVPAWLAFINLVLAVFNLVPAYPLDGGRVLRAALWARSGDRVEATLSAARSGRAFGYVLVGLGLLQFAAASVIGGLWFVFLGWFVLSAARAEAESVQVQDALDGVAVGEVMSPDPVVAPAWISVDDLLVDYAMRRRFSAFPLVDGNGTVAGLITLGRLKQVPPHARSVTRVIDVATPIDEVPTAGPDEPLLDLLERMSRSPDGRALVFDQGELVGIVSPTDVARVLTVASLRRRPPARPPART